MLAKYWKKIGLVIVIVACVFNVMMKLINKLSLNEEMLSSAQYVYDQEQAQTKKQEKENENKDKNSGNSKNEKNNKNQKNEK